MRFARFIRGTVVAKLLPQPVKLYIHRSDDCAGTVSRGCNNSCCNYYQSELRRLFIKPLVCCIRRHLRSFCWLSIQASCDRTRVPKCRRRTDVDVNRFACRHATQYSSFTVIPGCLDRRRISRASSDVFMRRLQLRFDCDSISIRVRYYFQATRRCT